MDNKNKPIPVDLFFTSYEPASKEIDAARKSPIIFIHGALSSPYCWSKVKNHIADRTGRKVYAICMRNHGTSGWSDEFSVDHMVADLEHFMATQNIHKAILVAHSLGGRAAIRFALERPHMVEKLVIEDMTLTVDEEQIQTGQKFGHILELAKNAVEQFPPSLSQAAAQKTLRPLFTFAFCKKASCKTASRPPSVPLPFYKDKSNKFVWDFNIDALINSLKDKVNFQTVLNDNSTFLGETLFTVGEYSKLPVFRDKELILKHFPNSKFVCAKNVYHNYHLEKPDEYVNLITNFIGV